jgi:membrane associated rhomboid family serine protease
VLAGLCVVAWLLSGDFPYEKAGWARSMVAWCGDVDALKEAARSQIEEDKQKVRRRHGEVPASHPAMADIAESEEFLESIAHWSRRPWTLLTCTFLHGSIMHLIGNMLFLIIFGRAVNGWLGNLTYTLLYLALGVVASVGNIVFSGSHFCGLVGASGAIAGVMGLSASVFPKYRVKFFYWFRFRMGTFQTPAFWALLLWFAWDLVQAVFFSVAGESGGVAFMAHVAGFVGGLGAGALVLKMELATRHDGDILNLFTGAPDKRERQRLREYISDMETERRGPTGPSLDDHLAAPPPTALPNRSRTASFGGAAFGARGARTDAGQSAPAGRLTAQVTESLRAATADPTRRAEALESYRQLLQLHPGVRLPLSAYRAAADIAHIASQWDLEVLTAERAARHHASDPATPPIVGRAARVCRERLGNPRRADQLEALLR